MIKKCFAIAALLTGMTWQGMAQSFDDYVWKEDMPAAPEIPAEYKSADAVVINSEQYSRSSFSGTFPYIQQLSTFRTQVHTKILTEEGVEDNNRIILRRFKGRIGDFVQYKTVDVRIKKADGKVKNYNVRDLPVPELDEEDDLYQFKDDLFIYELADLEIGDEMELITILETKFLDNGRTVNLYGQYPRLKSSFTISIPFKVGLEGSTYNNMPPVDFRKTSTNKIYKWEMTNLDAVPEANSAGTIFSEKLEYFIYELNLDAFREFQLSFKVNNYADRILQYSEDFLKVRVRKKRKLEEFYTKLFEDGAKLFEKKVEDLAAIEKVYLLNQHIAKNVQIINEELEDYEKSEGIEYFLLNGRTDRRNLSRIYRDFFERFEIPYYVAIAKNRLSGPIDLSFVSNTQINDYFFVFKNGDGFLPINGLGGLSELPWGFYDTKCYMRDITDRDAKLQEINFGKDALKDVANNKRFVRSQVQVSLNDNKVTQKTTTSLGGLYSRSGRGGIVNGHKADTLKKTVQYYLDENYKAYDKIKATVNDAKVVKFEPSPLANFAFKYTTDVTIENLIKVKDGKYSLDMDELLGHSTRQVVNPEDRQLDYHVPYLGNDKEEYILIFDQPVTLEDMEAYNQEVETDYARYEIKATQIKPNMIRIQSEYEVKQLFIPKDKVMELHKVNKVYNDLLKRKMSVMPKA